MIFNYKLKKSKPVNNFEGAKAWTLTPEMELYTAVVTASMGDKFYEKSSDRLNRIIQLIEKNDPAFVAKLAVYSREKMYLRSIPLVLAVELSKRNSGNNLVGKMVNRVVQRADEITELLAYYQWANARTGSKKLNRLSKQVQKGLAAAFNKFDEYQFAKYDREGAEIRLRDALFLTHPKAGNEDQQQIFNKIAAGNLATPYTWETTLSALGQQKFKNEAAKKAAFRTEWENLIDSGKLGYMALLRNLRNILEAGVSGKHIEKVCAILADARQVEQAKQLPFRFLAAYRELIKIQSGHVPALLNALESAVKASVVNIRGFGAETRVVIACDVSGSMQKPISAKSAVMCYDIGLLLAMLLQSKCRNVQSGMFGDTWKLINMPSGNILSNVQEFYKREGEVGYSTNGYLVVQALLAKKQVVDKVMIFTDCQLWDSTGSNNSLATVWNEYRAIVAPKAKLYLFDLAGLGNTPVEMHPKNGIYLIAGWSDKILEVLAALEDGRNAVEMVNRMEL